MNLREYRQQLISHLESISDEEFDQELILAGIEKQDTTLNISRDFIVNSEVEYANTTWGIQFYGLTRDDVVEVCFNGEAA